MNKIVSIFGADGMLGRYVANSVQKLNHIRKLTRKDCDISTATPEIFRTVIDGSDIVINCAGIIKQRKNISVVEMIQVNSVFPHILADICEQNKIPMIHITTDCVFSGKHSNAPYLEESPHDALDTYGKSKSLGEPTNACVIRTSIIGEKPEDSNSLLEWTKSQTGREVCGFTDHYWNGMTCLQLTNIITTIIEEGLFWRGIRHIHSSATDKHSLLQWIDKIYELDMDIVPISRGCEAIDRRLSSIYPKIFSIPSIPEQIQKQKDFIV